MSKPAGNQPAVIYHMLPRTRWESLPAGRPYQGDTLATEGFIHCTAEPALLTQVANRLYRAEPDEMLILCLATERILAPVRWEAADEWVFPHIYGPLNLDAVVGVVAFPRDADGRYQAPPLLSA